MQLSDDTLHALAGMHDPAGVLSIFVDASPDRQVGDPPAAEVSLRQSLKRLRDRVHDEGPRERFRQLTERLDALEPALSRLVEPDGHGRGRALFATVGDGRVEEITLQLPLPADVVLDESAYVRPLVAALATGDPVGVVNVSKQRVRAIDLRLGLAEECASFAFEERTDRDPRGTPQAGDNVGSGKEEFERSIDDDRLHFLRSAGDRVCQLAEQKGWETVVVTGDARLAKVLCELLAKANGRDVRTDQRTFDFQSADEVARALAPDLDEHRRLRELDLVERARDATLGARTGTLGMTDTLAALNDARVAHLLLDDTQELDGVRTTDGRLGTQAQPPLGAERAELQAEPRLTERMIERALEIDARVTLLQGPATEVLAEHDGVAALLRW